MSEMNKTDRFMRRVIKLDSGCWDWDSTYRGTGGYPMFYWGIVNGKEKNMKASRASYTLFKGNITNGMHVCHSCDNRSCVNPEHLWLGTHQDNMDDRQEKNRTNKWSERYNFRRSDNLILQINCLSKTGEKIEDICKKLNIGKSTYYRCLNMGVISRRYAKKC